MRKKIILPLTVALLATNVYAGDTDSMKDDNKVTVNINADDEGIEISPYIYGINTGVEQKAKNVAKSLRVGGNRMTAYNWENNYSNAGSDYHHQSDDMWVSSLPKDERSVSGAVALQMSETAEKCGIPYKLFTLQMQGYVSADGNGDVKAGEEAPSVRFKEVKNHKDAPFDESPDTDDDYVYMDEYLNYIISKIGDSQSPTGIQAYALDNEPALWSGTHKMIQSKPVLCRELIEKSVDLASTIKAADPKAEVFGPALYGYMAFVSLQGADDWEEIKKDGGYRWFIDYYLDEMKKASDEKGERLLDVLDLHYYTEQKGACGERSCSHFDNDDCIKARFDSYRSLWDDTFVENSWITDTGAEFFPLLPNIKESIDKYYPGTKYGFTEYDFGAGDHITGAIAQADALGTFAKYGVYFATLWQNNSKCDYQINTLRLFTNYDSEGHGFGNVLVPAESSDLGLVSAYAAKTDEDAGTLTIMLTNKNIHEDTKVSIKIAGGEAYDICEAYGLTGESVVLMRYGSFGEIDGDTINVTLPALSVTELVLSVSPEAKNETEADTESEENKETKDNASEKSSDAADENKAKDYGPEPGLSVVNIITISAGALLALAAVIALIMRARRKKN